MSKEIDMDKVREKIAKHFRCLRNCRIYPSLCRMKSKCRVKVDEEDYVWSDQILPLLQPLIERRVSQALEDNTLEIQEQARQAERDNIISYLESMAWIFNPEKELREFLGIISELKSGLWKEIQAIKGGENHARPKEDR